MKKLIPTTIHGVLDYITAPTLVVLPRLLKWNSKLTTFLSVAGLGTLAYSLVTRYELSILKLLPMKGHLTLDFMNGATLAAAPFLLLNKDERDTVTTGVMIGLGAYEIAASLMTQTEPSPQAEKSVVEQARELVNSRS